MNNYRLNLTNDEVYRLVINVVQVEISKEELHHYLEDAVTNY